MTIKARNDGGKKFYFHFLNDLPSDVFLCNQNKEKNHQTKSQTLTVQEKLKQ